MELIKEEKEVLRDLLRKQLKEVEQNQALRDQPIIILGTELKYGLFLENLIKKLE